MKTFPILLLSYLLSLPVAGEEIQVIGLRPGGHVTELDAQQLQDPASLGDIKTVWIWSKEVAPQRFAVGEPIPWADLSAKDLLRLRLAVFPADATDAVLRAAPVAMWEEVPEGSLPSFTFPEDRILELPRDRDLTWRLRLAGPRQGSWWIDVKPGQEEMFLSPEDGSICRFTVIDEDGEPVEDVVTDVLRSEPKGDAILTVARSDAAGVLSWPALPSGRELALRFKHPDFVPRKLSGRRESLPASVVLERGRTLRGRVVGSDEAPLVDVKVLVSTFVRDVEPWLLQRATLTHDDGHFELRGVPTGKAELRLAKAGIATKTQSFEVRARKASRDEALDLGTIVLRPGASLGVQLVDTAERAVAGGRVQVDRQTALSDAEGIAELANLPVGEHLTGHVEAKGFMPEDFGARLPRSEPLLVTLTPAFVATGTFLDPDGQPLEQATIRIVVGNRQSRGAVGVDGSFEVDLPPRKAAELIFAGPGVRELTVAVDPGDSGELRELGELRAARGYIVRGRTVSEDTGEAIPGARVWALRQGRAPLLAWVQGGLVETVSETDGSFSLSGFAEATTLRFDAPGWGRRTLDWAPRPETPIDDLGDVPLGRGVAVEILADPEELPHAVARVDLGNAWLEPDILTAPLVDGKALIPDVPPGEVTVSIFEPRDESVSCVKTVTIPREEDFVVDCQGAKTELTGIVLLEGTPAGAGTLVWSPEGPQSHAVILTQTAGQSLREGRTLWGGRPDVRVDVAADGFFTTSRLEPGAWQVYYTAIDHLTVPRRIELPEFDRLELELELGGMRISGRVMDHDGQLVAGARVEEKALGMLAISAGDGSFDFPIDGPGSYELRARWQERSSLPVPIEVTKDHLPGTIDLILEEASSELVVTVLDADFSPLGDAFIFVEEEGRNVRLLSADHGGRVRIPFDPPSPSRIRLAAYAEGRFILRSWQELDGETELILQADPETGAVRVESREAEGVPRILSATGWDLGWLLTRLGQRPFLAPDRPLILSGLPPGHYDLSLTSESRSVVVEGRDELSFRLD